MTIKPNRLSKLFREVKQKKRKIFSVYLTLGYTSLTHTEKVLRSAEKVGVDLIELGFPFSDPLADGPVIQEASTQALNRGVSFQDYLKLVQKLRKSGFEVPLIFFSYFNPIQKMGEVSVTGRLKRAGVDGLLVPDLPPEEGEEFHKIAKKQGLSLIYFLAPTSTKERIRMVSKKTDEFIYYVSSRGVTGVRKSLDADLKNNLQQIKRLTQKPVIIGFGISDAAKVRQASRISEGVIVGSALVSFMKKAGPSAGGIRKTENFLRRLKSGMSSL